MKIEQLAYKTERNLAPRLEANDIMPLVNKAFAHLFGCPELAAKKLLSMNGVRANYYIMLDSRLDNGGDNLSGTITEDNFDQNRDPEFFNRCCCHCYAEACAACQLIQSSQKALKNDGNRCTTKFEERSSLQKP